MRSANELVDAAVERQDVELALGVLAERRDVELGVLPEVDQLTVADQLAVLESQAPDPAAVEVAVDIDAGQLGELLAAVDVSAGDAQSPLSRRSRVGAWGYSTIGGWILAAESGRCRRCGWNE